jgi:DNA-directed RNA polymerase specialized sigma24 family protein
MDAKQFLRQVRYLDDLINTKLDQIQEIKSLAEKVTSTLSPDGTSPQSSVLQDKIGDLVSRIIDLQLEIKTAARKMIDLKTEAMRIIDIMPTPECRLLLQLRYLNGLTWERIAVDMNYSYRNVHYLHSRALQEFEAVRNKNIA